MTVVPLPASPCMRVRLDYKNIDGSQAGSRFFISYAGSAPSAANCNTIATDIANAWNTYLAQLVSSIWTNTEVDVQDIATHTGNFGTAAVSNPGTAGSAAPPANCATNVEFDISRRYRGGKPRMFLPPTDTSHLADNAHWAAAFVTSVNTQMGLFSGAIQGISVGSVGALAMVNVSYYQGFTNITNSSGRTYAAPKYRPTALVDTITAFSCKSLIGSQRRRRASSTP